MRRLTPRRRKSRPARLAITVLAPDGGSLAGRGLAAWLKKAAPRGACGEVTVALVSDGRIRALNRAFRGKDYATDVLSFPAANHGLTSQPRANAPNRPPERATGKTLTSAGLLKREGEDYLGDIVIATGVARRQADESGHPVNTELKVLALHGLLHLLGYDHERDSGEMARVESRLRKRAALKEGLISRDR